MKGSIFFKLLGILIITGILVNALVFVGVRVFINNNPIKRDMFATFNPDNLRKLADAIGFPPNIEEMKAISKTTQSDIRIESAGKVWQTADDLPTLDEADDHPPRHLRNFLRNQNLLNDRPSDAQGKRGFPDRGHPSDRESRGSPQHRGPFFDLIQSFAFQKAQPRPAIVIDVGPTRYGFFLPDHKNFADKHQKLLFPLLLLVTFLIASAFFAIRFILLPLQTLMKGVEAVAEGNLEHRVQVKGRDEFSALGESFNRMVERIKETMEAKERLLVDVSHELQSPLARMKLAIELMQEDKAKERLKVNLKDIEAMVAEILESARLDSSTGALQIQKSDMTHIIKDFLHVYEAMGSPVFFEGTQAPTLAEIDPSRFIIVLRNLIENALKHADAQNKRVDLRLMDAGEFVRIEVKDNGRGIPADEIARLFEPFYRIDKSRNRHTGGYGLGLSLCKRIINAHQGEIGIESDSTGTRVWFQLPRRSRVSS